MIYPLISNALTDFKNGDIISGLLRPITDIFGANNAISGQFVYAILFGIMFGMLMLKTQSAAMPAVVFILIMPIVFFLLPPEAAPVFYIFLSLSIAGTFYKIYTHRGG